MSYCGSYSTIRTLKSSSVTANEHAGKKVGDVHKNLLGLTSLVFEKAPEDLSQLNADVAFFALPHGQALTQIPQLPRDVKIVDLSGDFRIDDKEVFQQFYKLEHTADELQREFVYGLTETNRAAVKNARYIANPGCLRPRHCSRWRRSSRVDSRLAALLLMPKTGSSGSGAKPAANTHHPQRMTSFYAYKPFTHQHVPEISQHLRTLGKFDDEFVFMTHSLPVCAMEFCFVLRRT